MAETVRLEDFETGTINEVPVSGLPFDQLCLLYLGGADGVAEELRNQINSGEGVA